MNISTFLQKVKYGEHQVRPLRMEIVEEKYGGYTFGLHNVEFHAKIAGRQHE